MSTPQSEHNPTDAGFTLRGAGDRLYYIYSRQPVAISVIVGIAVAGLTSSFMGFLIGAALLPLLSPDERTG